MDYTGLADLALIVLSVLAVSFAALETKDYVLGWLLGLWVRKKERPSGVHVAIVEVTKENFETSLFGRYDGIVFHPLDYSGRDYVALREDAYELLVLQIRYSGPVVFKPFMWWIELSPSLHGYRILRRQDADDEPLPHPKQTSLHHTNAFLVNPDSRPSYDNLAYAWASEKRVKVSRRNMAVCEVESHGGSKELDIYTPLWIRTPKKIREGDKIQVKIRPPTIPFSQTFQIRIRPNVPTPAELDLRAGH